ncbi:hypothetical protein [Actinoplanes subglobosus]|uniref:Uncharacterized protein n=1 Tax=Actinoplanes subglobosus TaxID=1547892 RepID=A0ABV8J619_9ACTN
MQRIQVTGTGIVVTSINEPQVSVFGKVMRPGYTDVTDLPWDEISHVTYSVLELPPDDELWPTIVIDLTYGEYLEVHETADGYAEALEELCRLSGVPATAGARIWPPPAG